MIYNFLAPDDLHDNAPNRIRFATRQEINERLHHLAYFDGYEIPLVLDEFNVDFLSSLANSPKPDDWVGMMVRLEVYKDPNSAARIIYLCERH